MEEKERLLRDLCIEIARDQIGGKRFNDLLLETGIYLDEFEWEAANKLLGQSAPLMSLVSESHPAS